MHGCVFFAPVFFSVSAFSFPPLPQAAAGALAVIAYAAAQHANYAPHARFHIPGVGANDQRLRSDAAAPDLGRIVLRRALLFDVLLEDEEAARLGRGRRSRCIQCSPAPPLSQRPSALPPWRRGRSPCTAHPGRSFQRSLPPRQPRALSWDRHGAAGQPGGQRQHRHRHRT